MRSLLLAAAAAISLLACSAAGPPDASHTPSHPPTATAVAASTMQPINVDDLMGFYAQQTVFVADVDKISAITLLNHFTRYTIPTRSKAQVTTDTTTSTGSLYVLDGFEAAAARIAGATVRLRAFDLGNGQERASRSDIGAVGWVRSMGVAPDGRVLLLKADGRRAWVDAYDRTTLAPIGPVMEKAGCGDRLLAGRGRVAIVCLATGEIAVTDVLGRPATAIEDPLGELVGVAMAQDGMGAIYAVTADGRLGVAAQGATKISLLPWPREWTGQVLPDTLAVTATSFYELIALAQLSDDGAWLRETAASNLSQRQSLRLSGRTAGAPQFGLMAMSPFGYFTSGGSVRHVELNTGMLETMTEVGQGATIVAVVNR